MEEAISTVYVKILPDGCITEVNSSNFLQHFSEVANYWTKIDEGIGDKYHHAQNNYLDKPLTVENGLYNYKLVDGKIVERTETDKAIELSRIDSQREIAELKTKLAQTDYIAAKIAEGSATVDEYSEEIRKRREWRARINELEESIGRK